MDDELAWASEDLARARSLYQRVRETGQSADEAWEREGVRWRLIARNQALPDGRPDAYLTATLERSHWRFNWRDEDWSAASRVDRDT